MTASNNASSSLNDVSIRHRNVGQHRSEIAADLDPAAVGQADIEHGDVGRRCRRPLDRFGSRSGLADDLEIVGGLQEVAHPSPDHFVVVERGTPGSRPDLCSARLA